VLELTGEETEPVQAVRTPANIKKAMPKFLAWFFMAI
jgi:hypothetical protein